MNNHLWWKTLRYLLLHLLAELPLALIIAGGTLKWLLVPHPALHLLLAPLLGISTGLLLTDLGWHIYRVWTMRRGEPLPVMSWLDVGKDILVLAIFPVLLIGLLMWLHGYPW